jgi:hypothetical protein
MSRMAIGAPGDLFRIAEPIIFPMITIHIGLGGHVEDIVSLHHLLVAVASHADFGMEYAVGAEFRVVHRLDVMEIMTIVAGGGILISRRYRLSVDGLPVNRLMVVALDALGDDNALIILPILVGMNVGMAVGAVNPLLAMYAGIILGVFPLVTPFAPDLLHLDFALYVLREIGKLDMAAGAAVFCVHGRGKSSGRDLVPMASEARGRIDGHPLSPQGVRKEQNKQDRRHHGGNNFQHTDPPEKWKLAEKRRCKKLFVWLVDSGW